MHLDRFELPKSRTHTAAAIEQSAKVKEKENKAFNVYSIYDVRQKQQKAEKREQKKEKPQLLLVPLHLVVKRTLSEAACDNSVEPYSNVESQRSSVDVSELHKNRILSLWNREVFSQVVTPSLDWKPGPGYQLIPRSEHPGEGEKGREGRTGKTKNCALSRSLSLGAWCSALSSCSQLSAKYFDKQTGRFFPIPESHRRTQSSESMHRWPATPAFFNFFFVVIGEMSCFARLGIIFDRCFPLPGFVPRTRLWHVWCLSLLVCAPSLRLLTIVTILFPMLSTVEAASVMSLSYDY